MYIDKYMLCKTMNDMHAIVSFSSWTLTKPKRLCRHVAVAPARRFGFWQVLVTPRSWWPFQGSSDIRPGHFEWGKKSPMNQASFTVPFQYQ